LSKYKVTLNDPALPKGAEVEVPGLGVFANGSTTQVSEEQAEAYRDNNSQLVDVETDDRPAWSGAASVELRRGPTVLAAFEGHPVVSVEISRGPVEQAGKQEAPKASDSKGRQDKTEKES
jgi:hypothetical protein